MKLTKLFGKAFQVLLIYFVTPSYQLVNENIKGENKILTKKLNQIPTKNVGRLVKPVKTAQKLPVKASPIQITPQPLLTRRKVQLNPTETVKPQGFINNNKTPNSAKVDEPKPKHDPDESKNCTAYSSEPENRKHEESTFSEEFEDTSYKLENNKVDEPNHVKPDCKKETHELISETNKQEGIGNGEPENKEVVACRDFKTQKQEECDESDNTTQHLSSEVELKDDNDVPIDIHEEYKIRSNKRNNYSSSDKMHPPDKKKVLKITDVPLKVDSHVELKKDSVRTRKYENSEKNILYRAKTPCLTKVEINVSPKEMEKLTNDANDKIFIKKLDFEELHEKYDPSLCTDDKNEPNDSPYVPDITFIKESYKYPLEEQFDIDEICEIPITNKRFPSVANKSLRERIWRAWKNSEIHVKSDNNYKNKRKNVKKNNPNYNYFDGKGYDSVYSNIKFNPVNYGAYNSKADQNYKPNNVDEVIYVDGNVESDPINYGIYKSTVNQGNVADEKRYVDDYSSVKIEPVDEAYMSRADQSNRLTNIDDALRFSKYNKAKFGPPRYDTYNPKAHGNRPRNFDDVKRYFSDYGSAKFKPFKYEPYNTMPQRDFWRGMAPAKAGIRYYSPNEYTSPPVPNCYYPQSFGNQYAPISRYQKYLFPCM